MSNFNSFFQFFHDKMIFMKSVKKKTDAINLILNGHGQNRGAFISNFRRLMIFYAIYDRLENTNHSNIIREVFLNSKNVGETNVKMARITNTSESTLSRYKDKYLNCLSIIDSLFRSYSEDALLVWNFPAGEPISDEPPLNLK